MSDWHWTARLTKDEAEVVSRFSCSSEWLNSFTDEREVQDLESDGAPILLVSEIEEELRPALLTLESNAYVWPLGEGRWCLDEYGLPIWLTLKGLKSSCTVECV